MNYQYLVTPVGILRLVSDGAALVAIEFENRHRDSTGDEERSDPVLARVAAQLREYFDGRRRQFDLPLAPRGTPFQRSVWTALAGIPHGQTRSYGDIARAIRQPNASRAVGAANRRNPLPIVVPCHRVVGSDGSLTGFAGGLEVKRRLLELEGVL